MPAREVAEFQKELNGQLGFVFDKASARTEWRSMSSRDGIYSPQIDVAVGPFSEIRGRNRIEEFDSLMTEHQVFFEHLIYCHNDRMNRHRPDDNRVSNAYSMPTLCRLRRHNRNARCLVAIEIENTGSRKHLLGGALNAAALGRIGIIIPWTKDKEKATARLIYYWSFLRAVKKNAFDASNLLIAEPEELWTAMTKDYLSVASTE